MDAIASGYRLDHLYYLLEFLAVWEKRPACLTPIAFRWCSAITEVAIKFGRGEMPATPPRMPWHKLEFALRQGLRTYGPGLRSEPGMRFIYGLDAGLEGLGFYDGLGYDLRIRLRHRLEHRLGLGLGPGVGLGLALQLRQQGTVPSSSPEPLSSFLEREFSQIGPGYDIANLDYNSYSIREYLLDQTPHDCTRLLPITLEIGFRLAAPGHSNQPTPDMKHPPHHEQMFKIAFSSDDDEVIADATWAWIASGDHGPPSSLVDHLNERVGKDEPFSPRLRQACICGIECTLDTELEEPRLETVRLLNHLNVDMDDVARGHEWEMLLVGVIRSPTGLESLPSHYWYLLDKLVSARVEGVIFAPRDTEVMGSLEKAEDWEKLEVWLVSVWLSTNVPSDSTPMEDVLRVTLNLLTQRPSALPRFEGLCTTVSPWLGIDLREVCKQAQANRSASEAPPPYVAVRSFASPMCANISFLCLCFSQPTDDVPLSSPGDELLRSFIVYTTG